MPASVSVYQVAASLSLDFWQSKPPSKGTLVDQTLVHHLSAFVDKR